MKSLLIGLLVSAVLFLPAQSANAHVLITDESNTKGAIVHIIPDDDPIAGSQAALFFDTQDRLGGQAGSISLVITGPDGASSRVEVKSEGTLATANYTFPTRGLYELVFTVDSGNETYVFKQSQRVSRGDAASALDRQAYAWAEVSLLASCIGILLLGIMVFNRRNEIARQSRM